MTVIITTSILLYSNHYHIHSPLFEQKYHFCFTSTTSTISTTSTFQQLQHIQSHLKDDALGNLYTNVCAHSGTGVRYLPTPFPILFPPTGTTPSTGTTASTATIWRSSSLADAVAALAWWRCVGLVQLWWRLAAA